LAACGAKHRLLGIASAGAECSPPRGLRRREVFAGVRNRVESASENEARARSSRSGPSVDEIESSLHGQTLARPDGRTFSRAFRGAAATAVRGGRWESARRAVWPLAPAASRFSRSAVPATAATSTADRPAPAWPAATVFVAHAAAIDTASRVASITGITSARAASAAGEKPCAWGITVLSTPPRAPVCPPRFRRPPRMQHFRPTPLRPGPRRATARFAAGACGASHHPSAGRSAGSRPPARVCAGEIRS
jgi:hypothetical protein